MERNNRKKHIHIDRETGSSEIFAMLEKTESEIKSDTENLLEYSHTEYLTEEPIPVNKKESHQVLTPEAKVDFQGEVLDIDEPSAKPAYFRYRLYDVDFKAARLSINAMSQNDLPFLRGMTSDNLFCFLCDPLPTANKKRSATFYISKY